MHTRNYLALFWRYLAVNQNYLALTQTYVVLIRNYQALTKIYLVLIWNYLWNYLVLIKRIYQVLTRDMSLSLNFYNHFLKTIIWGAFRDKELVPIVMFAALILFYVWNSTAMFYFLHILHMYVPRGSSGGGTKVAALQQWPHNHVYGSCSADISCHFELPAEFELMRHLRGCETKQSVFKKDYTDSSSWQQVDCILWCVGVDTGGTGPGGGRLQRAAADTDCLLTPKWKPWNVSVWHPTSLDFFHQYLSKPVHSLFSQCSITAVHLFSYISVLLRSRQAELLPTNISTIILGPPWQ